MSDALVKSNPNTESTETVIERVSLENKKLKEEAQDLRFIRDYWAKEYEVTASMLDSEIKLREQCADAGLALADILKKKINKLTEKLNAADRYIKSLLDN